MLTTWFRQKYPNEVFAGLAASAPFNFVGSGISPYAFVDAASETFESSKKGCGTAITAAIQQMEALAITTPGRATLKQNFQLCSDLPDANAARAVINWAVDGLQGMAMLDYPYETNYGISVSAWPVNNTCERILSIPDDPVKGLAFGLGTFYNNTHNWTCYDIKSDVPDWGTCCGWEYLACTVTYQPFASRGIFPAREWNVTEDIKSCRARFGVTLDPEWPQTHWGGFESIPFTSNIIFSNGLLDPWHTSGVLKNISDSLIAIVIPASAHHLDLWAPDPADPIYVVQAREQEDTIIGSWIAKFFKS